jgi:hypothetical protein
MVRQISLSNLRLLPTTRVSTPSRRGRPVKELTAILNKFRSNNDRRFYAPVKLEVLTNCVIRKFLRKIDRFSRQEDKKLSAINDYVAAVDALIESHKAALINDIQKWFIQLRREGGKKNRQYNQREVHALLTQSELVFRVYKAFIEGLVSCPDSIKCQVLNLDHWPQGGNEALVQILLPVYLLQQVEAQNRLRCLERADGEYGLRHALIVRIQ